jgi:uncharacterized membrane protein
MTADAAGTSRRPRRRLFIALLVLSALLNVCFIAGAVWTLLQPSAERPRGSLHYREMAAQLNLDPQQRAGFDRYVAAMRERTDRMHQQIAPLLGAAWEEMGKPKADVAELMQLFDRASEKRRDFQRDATTQTLDFLSGLNQEQRSKFVAIARERRAPWLRPRNPPPH